jgi:hypothetical protein
MNAKNDTKHPTIADIVARDALICLFTFFIVKKVHAMGCSPSKLRRGSSIGIRRR